MVWYHSTMSLFLFTLATLLIIAGHIVKSLRQKQFSDFYEEVKLPVFNEALATGYLVNLIVPFRLGDILRAVMIGRKMKNGKTLGFSTVIVDRYLDIFCVGLIFLGLSVFGGGDSLRSASRFYIIFFFALILVYFGRYPPFPESYMTFPLSDESVSDSTVSVSVTV